MRKVIWSTKAKADYTDNIDYLLEHWSKNEAKNFIMSVERIIRDLKSGFAEFTPTNKKDVKRSVVCKQISLFYRIKSKNKVELIRFWNNYQDKRKLKY